MTDDRQTHSNRAQTRAKAQARREARAALAETSFEALAAGWSVRQVAELRKVSVRTIQREIDQVIDERRLDAPDRYIHLQATRLTKALRLADSGMDRGELAAITPLLKVVAQLDRYHGLHERAAVAASASAAIPLLPAPPLALTHAASSDETVDATDSGA